MNNASQTTLNVHYNNGLERGRKHQERAGYAAPGYVYELPAAERDAYLAGWQQGYDTVVWLGALRRPV